ncbi:MAG: hypothetical protein DI556_13530 [Rhodovulum sulfidophilum]|uniref:Uncharacterized protein n=1 Tax=Rhodovulum sulfidophilum TaxID=35806 RepID=A0A2W5N5R2_RHOSU|nr:MAG: hypothetical protein DI556_13530 [Rhodovulum sulfidophilum]
MRVALRRMSVATTILLRAMFIVAYYVVFFLLSMILTTMGTLVIAKSVGILAAPLATFLCIWCCASCFQNTQVDPRFPDGR